MEIDRWVDGYKVRGIPWIDGKRYYINIQYFLPGASIEKPPAWEKTVYIIINEKGMDVIKNYLSTLVRNISMLNFNRNEEITLTF